MKSSIYINKGYDVLESIQWNENIVNKILALSTEIYLKFPNLLKNDPDVVVHFTIAVLSIQFISRYRVSTTVGIIWVVTFWTQSSAATIINGTFIDI